MPVLLFFFFATKLGAAMAAPQTAKLAQLCQNSFAGAVYGDQNNNHERDSNEVYLPGVVVIQAANGNLVVNVESSDGLFLSSILPCGTYQIIHNAVAVDEIVVTENMGQDLREFPKLIQLFLPWVAG